MGGCMRVLNSEFAMVLFVLPIKVPYPNHELTHRLKALFI